MDCQLADLVIRLREIGRPDVGAKLSRAVYHEKAQEARDAFINDPFKKFIHTNSPMLVESAQVGPTGSSYRTKSAPMTARNIIVILSLTVVIIALCVFIAALNCPNICNNSLCEAIGRKFYGVPNDVILHDDDQGSSTRNRSIADLEEEVQLLEAAGNEAVGNIA